MAARPTYTSRKQLPSQMGAPFAPVAPSTAVGEGISDIGRVLYLRGLEMQKERNAAVVSEAVSEFRDLARNKISELFKLKGRDAVGLGEKYDEWFDDALEDFLSKRVENGKQQNAFKSRALLDRDNDLDNLAQYQAREAQLYNVDSHNALVASAVKDVQSNPFNIERSNRLLNDIYRDADIKFKGENTELEKQKATAMVRVAQIQAMADIDANGAKVFLEEWKSELGEEYYVWKNKVATKERDQIIAQLRVELNTKYNEGGIPNFNKMQDAIQKDKTIPDEIKDSLVAWISVQENEYNGRIKKQESERLEFEMNEIFEAVRGGDYLAAYQKVLSATQLTQVQKYRIENIIKSEKEVDTDKQVYMDLAKLAMTPDSGLEMRDIVDSIGKGIDVTEARGLLSDYRTAREPGMKVLNTAKKEAIETIEKQVIKGSSLIGYDSGSVNDAYLAVQEFMEIWDNPPEGATKLDLVNPESKFYIIEKIIRNKVVPLNIQLERMADQFRLGDELEHKEGETPEEYLIRTTKKKK